MAKITKSATAPAGTINVTSAAGDFSVSDGESFETSDQNLLANIASSTFLAIEYDAAEPIEETHIEPVAEDPAPDEPAEGESH